MYPFRIERSSRHGLQWLLIFADLVIAGCINAPAGDWCPLSGHPDPIDPNCLRRVESERYLIKMDEAVQRAWKYPPGFNESAYVKIRFVLSSDGAVADRCVSRSSDSRLAKSALDALDAASPLPPMPRFARCIAGAEIVRHVYSAER